MNQILNKLLVIGLLCGATFGHGQSLPEFINAALERNYQIRIVKNEAQIAVNNNTAGNAGQLPSVGVDGSASTSFNNTEQKLADGSIRSGENAQNSSINAAITANWTLFDGFRVQAKKTQLDLLEQLGDQNAQFYIEQTVSDIVYAYHRLKYENQLLENYKASLGISQYRFELEKKRKEVGSGKAIDYGQALSDYQTDSIRYLAQLNAIKTLEIEINRIINNPLEQSLSIASDSFSVATLPNKDSLLFAVSNYNRQFQQQQLLELISETELRMARADRYPKIDLFAGYQFAKSFSEVGFITSNQNFGPTIGATISFNLFNGGQTSTAIKNSAVYQENAKLTKEQTHNNLDADVLRLYYEYLSIKERVVLAKNAEAAVEQVYAIAAEQLKRGAINGYDFRITQLTLLEAQLRLMGLEYSLKAVEIDLNRLTGQVVEAYL